jgi:hypothetical protein
MRPGLARSRESKCAASGWLRHFLFTWLKTQGIDDALIEPYSGHASRTSLEIYSRLAPPGAQASYDGVIGQSAPGRGCIGGLARDRRVCRVM